MVVIGLRRTDNFGALIKRELFRLVSRKPNRWAWLAASCYAR